MDRTTSRRLHTSGMSLKAKDVLDAVIKYAEENKKTRCHSMLIGEFCNFSGLDADTPVREVVNLMTQTRKAVVSVKVINTTSSGKKEVAAGSSPVFSSILITKTHVSFEVCRYMWDEFELRN
ncbi:hypothetical protein ACWYXK_06805 [Janthinobacterium lividum]